MAGLVGMAGLVRASMSQYGSGMVRMGHIANLCQWLQLRRLMVWSSTHARGTPIDTRIIISYYASMAQACNVLWLRL